MVYVSSLETPFSTNIDKNAHPYTFPSHGFWLRLYIVTSSLQEY